MCRSDSKLTNERTLARADQHRAAASDYPRPADVAAAGLYFSEAGFKGCVVITAMRLTRTPLRDTLGRTATQKADILAHSWSKNGQLVSLVSNPLVAVPILEL